MKKNLFWIIFLVVIAGLLYLAFKQSKNPKEVFQTLNYKEEASEKLPLVEGQEVQDVNGKKEFKHGILGFSFQYPKAYDISSFGNYFDAPGQTILIQKNGKGGQVVITPFDEDISLTALRIKKDLPNLSMGDVKEMKVGNIEAVTFTSTNSLSTGKSLEAWFVYHGNLYQISAEEEEASLYNDIINSWKIE